MGAVFYDGESFPAEAGEEAFDGVVVEGDILGDWGGRLAAGGASEDLGAQAGSGFRVGLLNSLQVSLLFGRERDG